MAYYGFGAPEAILQDLHDVILAKDLIQFVDWQMIADSGITESRVPGCYVNYVRIDKKILLKDIVKNEFLVTIVGHEIVKNDENLGSAMTVFIETVKDAIRADPQRDSNAYDTIITAVETDGGSNYPAGVFIMGLNIIFFSEE